MLQRQKEKSHLACTGCLPQGDHRGVSTISTAATDLAEKEVNPCKAIKTCTKKLECGQKDNFNELIPILSDPDLGGIIVASPVYMGAMRASARHFWIGASCSGATDSCSGTRSGASSRSVGIGHGDGE